MMKIPSIKKLRKIIYKDEPEDLLARLTRKFSIYGTWFFLNIKGITPTQITILGFPVALIAAIFFATGDYYYGLVGGFLVYLGYYIDCLDGEVARFKKMHTIEGHHFDALVGHFADVLFIIGIALGAFFKTQSNIVLILGTIMVSSFVLYHLLVNLRYATYNHYIFNYKNKQKKNLEQTITNSKPNLFQRLLGKLSKFIFIYQVSFRFALIVILSFIGRLEYFVYLYAIIHPPFLVINIIYQYYGGLQAFFDRTEHYQKTGEVTSFADT